MSKEKKPTTAPQKDPQIKFDRSQFFQNRLALPEALKSRLAEEGLDYRFLNASQFRINGNFHHSHWRPYKVTGNPEELGLLGVTAEGLIQRGDLILGVREKYVTAEHKKFLAEQNRKYARYNKDKAQEMRKLAREHQISDETTIHEGYEDNE